MKVELNKNKSQIAFKGPLDGVVTASLMAIDTNPMMNAAIVDVFAMVAPRTYIDAKKRNKYAGAETFFREISGTVINCFAAAYIARGLAFGYSKFINPETKISHNTWLTNDSFNLLKQSWDESGENVEKYVSNILTNISGNEGKNHSAWKNVDWDRVEWFDSPAWKDFGWKNHDFRLLPDRLKDEEGIVSTLTKIILDRNMDEKDARQALDIVAHRIANAIRVENSVEVKLSDNHLNSSLKNIVRDIYDMGKGVFTNKDINLESALRKIQGMNRFKSIGAIAIASLIGVTNQYINRQITKKRTGKDEFVGDVGYKNSLNPKCGAKTPSEKGKVSLNFFKAAAVAVMISMAAVVMKVKNPKDFIKKLEFSAPITDGNAIKAVYAATLTGRFLAARNETELRETCTRDYLGFLNWLVFGGFVSKGVANLLDKGRDNLFNIHKEGKGIKNWLYNISLKSHAEIASKGAEFAKKNVWKLNLAHTAGLVYSLLALGLFLPLLNIAITKRNYRKDYPNCPDVNFKGKLPKAFQGFM